MISSTANSLEQEAKDNIFFSFNYRKLCMNSQTKWECEFFRILHTFQIDWSKAFSNKF